jgi:hypothetical protein
MGAVSTATAIDTPPFIYSADSQSLSVRSAISLSVGYLLSWFYGDLSACLKRLGCKASFAMNRGTFNVQTWGEFQFHVSRVTFGVRV